MKEKKGETEWSLKTNQKELCQNKNGKELWSFVTILNSNFIIKCLRAFIFSKKKVDIFSKWHLDSIHSQLANLQILTVAANCLEKKHTNLWTNKTPATSIYKTKTSNVY